VVAVFTDFIDDESVNPCAKSPKLESTFIILGLDGLDWLIRDFCTRNNPMSLSGTLNRSLREPDLDRGDSDGLPSGGSLGGRRWFVTKGAFQRNPTESA